ncbi:trigger factor [Aeromicrobium sp. YIM 150415]|uniref:Trigger factor n=1 Tax=Aeromicrobium piscarium TaxID=2590901 RepID=A0A554SB53_9ACTN|nr:MULTISPECIES: trigger factor [Aeromicrobium]MBM9463269.1 trigger factor [Aeromicrobium sp. YIM 150415]TSD63562.1 trigger factor [Aeromicrobium piscarium]
MKSSTETLSPTRVKLTIEVPFEEFKSHLDKAYKSIGSQITVPGFRKGKVPAPVIDQRVGRAAVLDEALNSALPGWYNEALQEQTLQPLGQPEIDLAKFDDGSDIEVTAEVDIRPSVELPDLKGIELEVEDAEVTDADVDEQLEALRERFATYTEVDRPAADGDSVTIDLSAAQKDGTLIEEAQASGLPYQVGKATMIEGLDEALIGLEKGASATFSTQLVGGELAGDEVDVTVTLTEVKEQQLPEVDEEFVQMASEFDTVEELRADLVERLTRGKRMEQAAEARDLVLEKILDQIEVPLPESLVETEVTARRDQIQQQLQFAGLTFEGYLEDQSQTEEEFEAELERGVRDSIAAQFVLDQVVEDNEFGIDDQELSQHIMRRAQESGQDPNQFVQHIMEHNHVPEMVGEVMRGKALASLVEGATVKDKSGNELDLARLRADGSVADEDESEAEEPAN